MRATNEQIQGIYDIALNRGHPDPLGFVARLEVLTNLDHEHGGTGIGIAQLEKGTESDSDITTIEGNVVAAVALDIDNYSQLNSLPAMHAAAAFGVMEASKPKSKKLSVFAGKLTTARKSIASILGVSSEEPDSAIERESDELTGRVVRREAFNFDRQIASPDPVAEAFDSLDGATGLEPGALDDPTLAIDPVDLEEERQIQAIMKILRRL